MRLGRAILDGQLCQSLRLLYHCRAGVHTLHRQYFIFRTWTLTGLHSLGAALQAPSGLLIALTGGAARGRMLIIAPC